MSVELGSFWLIKDSGYIATVKSIIAKANGGATVVYTITDNSGISSYRLSCEYERFTNIAEKLITKSELKDELNTEYVKGKTDGYNEGYQHGFTLAKEKITDLDEQEKQSIYYEGYDSGHNQWQNDYGFTIPNNTVKNLEATNYKKGLKDAVSINAATRQHHYDMGYNDALAYMASEEAEKKLELKKQGYDGGFEDGFNKAIKEMSNNQALDETTEYEFGTEDCCEHHNPNKETQEAMQEVVDKISYKGVWASNENNPDWEIEYHSDCGAYLWVKIIKKPDMALGYTVGQLFTISKSALREGYSKKYVGDVNSKVEGEQLEKELVLVEKYPHYYKDIRHLNIIDIYRFFDLFEVTDPCIQHSMKKLAVGGKRGAKDYEKDIKEAMDTLKRWEYMQEENKRGLDD